MSASATARLAYIPPLERPMTTCWKKFATRQLRESSTPDDEGDDPAAGEAGPRARQALFRYEPYARSSDDGRFGPPDRHVGSRRVRRSRRRNELTLGDARTYRRVFRRA